MKFSIERQTELAKEFGLLGGVWPTEAEFEFMDSLSAKRKSARPVIFSPRAAAQTLNSMAIAMGLKDYQELVARVILGQRAAKPEFSGSVQAVNSMAIALGVHNHWEFVARDKEGNVKWVEEFDNLTTTQGLNDILTKYFTGSGYTAAWYCRLVDNVGFGAFAATDTAAEITTSTPGGGSNNWQENTGYSNGTAPAITFGSASAGSISNTSSPAVFNINATVTIYGGFATSTDTPGGTSGILYGEGAFSATRSLLNGDTLTVTVTMTAAST